MQHYCELNDFRSCFKIAKGGENCHEVRLYFAETYRTRQFILTRLARAPWGGNTSMYMRSAKHVDFNFGEINKDT
jgi:hypothetical protein